MIDIFGFSIPVPQELGWLDTPVAEFLMTALVWSIIALLAYVFMTYVLRWVTHRLPGDVDDLILGIVRRPLLVLLVSFGVISSVRALQLPPDITIWLERILLTAEIIVAAWVVWRIVHDIVVFYGKQWAVRTENRLDDIVIPLINLVGATVIVVGTILLILSIFGIDVSSMLIGAGVIGLVLGLALQDTLSNVFSGITLIADTPFRTGDLIALEDKKIYRVDKIGLRTTTLYSFEDHSSTYIPNRVLTDQPIENITKPTVELLLTVDVGVAFNSDLPRVENILQEIAWAHPNVLGSDQHHKIASVTAEMERIRGLGEKQAADTLERALVKMEREHTLLDRIREFDEMLRQLAEQISFREEHGLTAEEIRELNVEYLAPGNIMLEHVNAALNQWRALADPWAELDELEEENERWQLRLERLERRWVHVRDSILNPSIEQTGRLDTMTSELRTYLREELKYPPEAWKDPTVYFVEFGDSSVDMRLAYFIDDGRLEHFKRRTRVAREIGFTILKRFEELGIEVPYPQLEVFYKGP